MIEEIKHGEWTCHTKESIYFNAFKDFLSLRFKVLQKYKTSAHTKVALIEVKAGLFIIKIHAPREKIVEKAFKSIMFGSYQVNLIYQIERAKLMGDTFVNDFYFLAERKYYGFPQVSVMLFEYIPGVNLDELTSVPNVVIQDIALSVNKMHALGIISGDPHRGNFILSPDGIRAIDLSGKNCSAKRIAQDNVMLERHFSIPAKRNFWHFIVTFKNEKRRIKKALKLKLMSSFRYKSKTTEDNSAIHKNRLLS
ncbi:lipopolysaccharide core heptose(II) kinase RfaY [Klebsiella aerogenes]|uniref:lipopolysaccharide core heptose(II) kinase RfaY n=1 Tax=Klebsiella aerogenes TaxID=548 RepID=UPI001F300137|nr:lipopolysaccharide core heptose(II) kinase RfaY [Klebsiella aerogenes]